MKVSKNVSIDIGLLWEVTHREKKFSKAVTEALLLWLRTDPKVLEKVLAEDQA